ncbi:hypothetical protein ON010_g1239 [Phytophthora cinnamomi]|nr:hypothetical protein ON010_g1239 [Phytophthora cinnamomi]
MRDQRDHQIAARTVEEKINPARERLVQYLLDVLHRVTNGPIVFKLTEKVCFSVRIAGVLGETTDWSVPPAAAVAKTVSPDSILPASSRDARAHTVDVNDMASAALDDVLTVVWTETTVYSAKAAGAEDTLISSFLLLTNLRDAVANENGVDTLANFGDDPDCSVRARTFEASSEWHLLMPNKAASNTSLSATHAAVFLTTAFNSTWHRKLDNLAGVTIGLGH